MQLEPEPRALPDSWAEVRLDDVIAQFQYGLSLPMSASGRYPILRMAAIQDGEVLVSDLKYVDLPEAVARRYLLNAGDVLLNRTNSAELVGKVGIYRSAVPAVFASYLIRLKRKPTAIDNYFLGYALMSYPMQCRIRRFATPGVQQVNINATNLGRVILWLPSGNGALDEQCRIARILEAVDDAIRQARVIREEARRLRLGIMQAAFDGIAGEPVKLGTLITDIRYGTSQASNDSGWGFPTLRIPNVVHGAIDTADVTCVHARGSDIERHTAHPGDLLLVRTNGNPEYVGRSAVFIPPDDRRWLFASYLIRVRLDCRVLPRFVDEYLKVERGRRELLRRVTTSAGNHNINSKSIESLPIRVPESKAAQERIVALADAATARINRVRASIDLLGRLKRGLMQDLLTGRVRVSLSPASRAVGSRRASARVLETS